MAHASSGIGSRIRFDWLDVVLMVLAGTLVSVALTHLSRPATPGSSYFVVRGTGLLTFLPLVVRRLFFGMPQGGEMKTGALWSLSGIVGLFALLFGMGACLVGVWGMSIVVGESEPDWAATIHEEEDAGRANFGFGGAVAQIPGESAEATAQRLKRQEEESEARYVAEQIPLRHQAWLAERTKRESVDLALLVAGMLMCAVGAALDAIRYRRREPAAATLPSAPLS